MTHPPNRPEGEGQGVREAVPDASRGMAVPLWPEEVRAVMALEPAGTLELRRAVDPQPRRNQDMAFAVDKGCWLWTNREACEKALATYHTPFKTFAIGDRLAAKADCEERCLGGYVNERMCNGCAVDEITLEVVAVRVERLEDILLGQGQAIAQVEPPKGLEPADFPEGFEKWSEGRREEWIQGQARATYMTRCNFESMIASTHDAIWDHHNPEHPASSNPWVAVYTVKAAP